MLKAYTPPQELWQGTLSHAELDQYRDDLMANAVMLGIQAKRSTNEMVDSIQALTLEQALSGVLTGRFRAIQLCYSYDNRVWCDTLLRQTQCYTLIRTF
jgi:hypothetical protein